MIDLSLYQRIELPDQSGIKKLVPLNPSEGSPGAAINPKLMKKITLSIESFSPSGEIPIMQKHFFREKLRAIDPKKADNNLPIGVLACLAHLAPKEEGWFELPPEQQDNAFIKNYPIEQTPLYFHLKIVELVRCKDVNSNDFCSYVNVGEVCREEGNELFYTGKISQAANQYNKGIQILKNLPKKFTEIQGGIENEQNLIKERAEETKGVKLRLLNNLAWCNIKLEKYTEALENCRQVLEMDPENEKAIYRKGRIFELTQEFEKALEMYSVIKMENRLSAVRDSQKNYEKQFYRNFKREFE